MKSGFARPNTYYRATVKDDWVQRSQLSGRIDAQVVVIGAGFAGLNTALELLERGVTDVVVIEAGEIGQGASGRNGGFVFGGYSLAEDALLAQNHLTDAQRLYALTAEAVRTIRARAMTSTLDCHVSDAGVVWANWFQVDQMITPRQVLLRDSYGVQWEPLDPTALRTYVRSDQYSAGMFEREAFHFHPLRYAAELARRIEQFGGKIFTHSPVVSIDKDGLRWRISTEGGDVHARETVLCGGGYHHGLHRMAEAAMMPISTYVMVTEPLGDRLSAVLPGSAAVYDSRFAFDYYRKLNDGRLLWGGRISVVDPSTDRAQALLQKDMSRVFPSLKDVRIDYAWSGLMSYARHQMPQLARTVDGLWVAQAFGGHGVATTTVGGQVMAQAIEAYLSSKPMPPDWQWFAPYGLSRTHGKFGLAAAQLTYWKAQSLDWFRKRVTKR